MSRSSIEKIECSNCGKEFEFEMHQSVNVTLDPDLKKLVFNNGLFKYTCPHCGVEQNILYPVLYHDMTEGRNFMVQFGSPNYVDEFEYMSIPEENSERDIDQIMIKAMRNTPRRGVTNIPDFIEKIVILENGYDDRIIEVIRREIIEEITAEFKKEKKRDKIKDTFFDVAETNSGEKVFVCIVYTEKAKEPIYIPIKDAQYQNVYNRYKHRLSYYNNCVVDQSFADKFIHDTKQNLPPDIKEDDRELFCTYDENGIFHLCLRKHTFLSKVKKGDIVAIQTDAGIKPVKVERIVIRNYTVLPKWPSQYETVVSIWGEEIKEAIERCKKQDNLTNKMELINALKGKVLLLPVRVIMDDADEEQFINAKVGDTITSTGDIRLRFVMTEINGLKYFPIYVEEKDIIDTSTYSSIVNHHFEDIVEKVKSDDEQSGIVINPESDRIVVSKEDLMLFVK